MKLRILDNTLRFRLSKPEVDQLVAGDMLSAAVRFPTGQCFSYSLCPDSQVSAFRATFDDGDMTIRLPIDAGSALRHEDTVTISEHIPTNSAALVVTIEKDFKCLTPRDEDESNLFRNPTKSMDRC